MSNLSNVLLGTAVGAVLGILYAPDKGEETRKKLRAEALVAKDKLTEKAEELKEQATSQINSKKESFDAQLEDVLSNVSYKADDIISSLEKKLQILKEKNKSLQKKEVNTFENKISDEPLTV